MMFPPDTLDTTMLQQETTSEPTFTIIWLSGVVLGYVLSWWIHTYTGD